MTPENSMPQTSKRFNVSSFHETKSYELKNSNRFILENLELLFFEIVNDKDYTLVDCIYIDPKDIIRLVNNATQKPFYIVKSKTFNDYIELVDDNGKGFDLPVHPSSTIFDNSKDVNRIDDLPEEIYGYFILNRKPSDPSQTSMGILLTPDELPLDQAKKTYGYNGELFANSINKPQVNSESRNIIQF